MTISYDDWALIYNEAFDTPLDRSRFNTSYIWPRDQIINEELQQYIDWEAPDGWSPFSIVNGILTIEARRTPTDQLAASNGQIYQSGLLTSRLKGHTQTHGRLEARMKPPKGQGLWPAFWMLPTFKRWPDGIAVLPEVDIVEWLGHQLKKFHTSLHWNIDGVLQSKGVGHELDTLVSDDFHVYGCEWNRTEIIFYIDGFERLRLQLPADHYEPKHWLLNLAVGGKWPGSPDETTQFPARFQIDWIRGWMPLVNMSEDIPTIITEPIKEIVAEKLEPAVIEPIPKAETATMPDEIPTLVNVVEEPTATTYRDMAVSLRKAADYLETIPDPIDIVSIPEELDDSVPLAVETIDDPAVLPVKDYKPIMVGKPIVEAQATTAIVSFVFDRKAPARIKFADAGGQERIGPEELSHKYDKHEQNLSGLSEAFSHLAWIETVDDHGVWSPVSEPFKIDTVKKKVVSASASTTAETFAGHDLIGLYYNPSLQKQRWANGVSKSAVVPISDKSFQAVIVPNKNISTRVQASHNLDDNGLGKPTTYWISQKITLEHPFSFGTKAYGFKLGGGLASLKTASGGDMRTDGWSVRFGGRKEEAILYVYHQNRPKKWGEDFTLGKMVSGGTYDMKFAVTPNTTATSKDGRLQGWFNGELVVDEKRMTFWTTGAEYNGFVANVWMSLFFGGATTDYAPEHANRITYHSFDHGSDLGDKKKT